MRITKAKTWFSGRCFSNGPTPRRRRSWLSWRNNITPSRLRTTKWSIGSMTGAASAAVAKDSRSEERRVGEECRSRGAPYQLKKKRLHHFVYCEADQSEGYEKLGERHVHEE